MKPPRTLPPTPSQARADDGQPRHIFKINKPRSSASARASTSSDSVEPSARTISDSQKKELSKKARLPFGTRLIHWMRLLSPMEWMRFAQFRMLPVDWRALFNAACGIVLPFLVYYPTMMLLSSGSGPTSSLLSRGASVSNPLPRFVIPYLCSPWALQCLHRGSKPFVQLVNAAKSRTSYLAKTLPEATECLGEAIQEGRAYRSRMYDVYLPPPPSATQPTLDYRAVLFLPGMGVSHTAYAIPARMLSELGNIVVVVSGEPWRAVTHLWHHKPKYVSQHVMKRVEKRHKTRQWSFVGHSLGSFTATHLVPELRHAHNISALAMWASAPFPDALNDLSKSSIKVMVVQGSDDVLIRAFGTEAGVEQFWKLLPPSSSRKEAEHTISGGTHSGFASYVSSNPQFRESTEGTFEQQRCAVELTHDFFKRVPGTQAIP